MATTHLVKLPGKPWRPLGAGEKIPAQRVMGVPSLRTQLALRWPDRSAQRKTGYPQKE